MSTKPDHCIFFLLDGFRPDVLRQLMDAGKLPNLTELFDTQGTFWKGTTVFPSTTGPAYLPMVTGCFPGTCNVPGIRWVDRKNFKGAWDKQGTRSYVGPESFLFNQDIAPNIKTIFDVFPNHLSIHNLANKGVSKSAEPSKLKSTLMIFAAKLSHQWKMVDDFAAKLATKMLKARDITFSFIAFLGVDEAAHLSSPFSHQTLESYTQVDASVGKIIQVLKDKAIYERTLIFASADHGLSETKIISNFVISSINWGLKHLSIQRCTNETTMQLAWFREIRWRIYISKIKTWEEHMFHEDLLEKNLIEPFLQQEAIDILITKRKNGNVMATSRRGQAEISSVDGRVQYLPTTGDPFGFPIGLDSKNNYFDATVDTNYPDAILQSWQIMNSSRAGDLIVTASIGFDLRDRFEIPEHFSSHGSLHAEHMAVPILCNRKIETTQAKRTVNIFPTMLKMMGVDPSTFKIDGKSFI